jgi:hypothetical protein
MLSGLRHGAVGGGNHQDGAVHLRRSGDHVLDVVRMAGTVDMGIVTLIGLVFHMRRRDRDAALPFFRRLVDIVVGYKGRHVLERQHLRDGRCQGRLAVVHVADGAHVHMRLCPLKFCFCHAVAS